MKGVGFAIAVLAMLLTLGSVALHDVWLFDVLASLRVQALIGSAVLAAAALFFRKWYAGGLLACCMIVNAALMIPAMNRAASPMQPDANDLSLLFYNSAQNTLALHPLLAFVKERQPDVLAFTEVHRWDIDNLRKTFPDYRHSVGEPGVFGAVILSRLPIRDFKVHRFTPAPGGRTLEIRLCAPDNMSRCTAMLVLHPTPPIGSDFHARRNEHLMSTAELARSIGEESGIDGRVVMAGDFNVTPWNRVYLDALDTGALHDLFSSDLPHSTWFSSSIVLGLPIDHVWAGDGVASRQTEIGPLSGSDHLPIYVEMSMGLSMRP